MRHSLIPSAQKMPHYGALLTILLILIVVAPLVPADLPDYGVELFFDLVLVTGAYHVAQTSKHRFPFLVLTLVTLGTRWTDMVLDHTAFSLTSIALVVAWLSYAVWVIVVALFRMQKVDTNTILGAMVAYILAAIAFSSLFELIELVQPGSFTGVPVDGPQRQLEHALLYFSFVSITTMGYGDIAPISDLARSFACLEGMFGIFYLAVMIARLVSLHSASPSEA